MEGPTPVSAYCIQQQWLRGYIFIVKSSFLFENSFPLLSFYFCGTVTTLLAALGAYFQTDMKRIIAYLLVAN
jgi:NADH:ubiquinone oxidoreductase subunit 5 (subunit L)/multisubunit Na+/H+ antiporter MnhA subunit